jgi:hypothetical protein
MLMANQQSAKLSQPSVGSFHNPATFVTPQLPSVFIASVQVIIPVRHDQIDTTLSEPFSQRIGVVSPIRNYALGLLSRPTLRLRDLDLGERGFRKRNFIRRGTFQPNSQRNTFTVDQYHPLCALATLSFSHRRAPFLAGAKLPSKKLSSHRSSPSASNAPRKRRQACSQIPFSSHCCNLRQHVEGEGKWSGKNRQAAPVCKIHKMPSKQARFDAHGRPRPSRRRFGFGNKGSSNSHCSSVNSFCRCFMTELQQLTHLTHKYLL